MNGLNSFKKLTEYSLAPTDNLSRLWRSKVKVSEGHWDEILWTQYLTKYLSNLDETCRKYSKTLYFGCILILQISYVENSLHFNLAYFQALIFYVDKVMVTGKRQKFTYI